MLLFLRTFFTVGFFYLLLKGSSDVNAADTASLFMIVPALLMALFAGLTWAPYIGEKVAAPLTAILTAGSDYCEEEAWLVRLMQWAERRKHRRIVLFLCILHALDHPSLPTAYRVGLDYVKSGSWLERHFARKLYEFGNAQNALRAYKILMEHGIKPPAHSSPDVAMMIQSCEMQVPPDRPPIPVPHLPSPASVKRDPRIELFESPKPGPKTGGVSSQ